MPHHVTEKTRNGQHSRTYSHKYARSLIHSVSQISSSQNLTPAKSTSKPSFWHSIRKRFYVDAFSHRRRRDQLCPRRNLHHSTLPNVRGIRNYKQCVSIPQPQRSASQDENLHRMCKCVCGNEQCGRKDGDIILITTSSFRLADLISINNTSAYEFLTCSIIWK